MTIFAGQITHQDEDVQSEYYHLADRDGMLDSQGGAGIFKSSFYYIA